jgi:hypothetical protein
LGRYENAPTLFGFDPKLDIWLYPTGGRFVAVGAELLVTVVTVVVGDGVGVIVGVGVDVGLALAVPGKH